MRTAFRNFRGLIALAEPASHQCGAVAQLGERLNGIQEVIGSIPFGSTKIPPLPPPAYVVLRPSA